MSTNNIDEIFRRGMGNQSQDAPDDMWDRISDEMNHTSRRRTVWFAIAASVALLLSVGVALVEFGKPAQQVTEKQPADTTENMPALHQSDMLETPNYADSATYIAE